MVSGSELETQFKLHPYHLNITFHECIKGSEFGEENHESHTS